MGSDGPLRGMRVVELATFIAGPFAGQLLADMGADVVKVEQPGQGDPFRNFAGGLYGPHFVAYNRNKRSIAVDTRPDAGKQIVRRLLERADVFLENFRPGVMARMGLDYHTVREWNPRLIYCSVTGFGQSGPYRDRPSYDGVGQGLSGLTAQLVDPDRPRIVGPAFSDCITGMTAANAILAAWVARERTRKGQHVDVSMLAATAGFLASEVSMFFQTGDRGDARTRARLSHSFAFRCGDGKLISVHCSAPVKFFEALLRAVGRVDLLEEADFATRTARIAHFDELEDVLGTEFAKRPRAEWAAILEERDVPYASVYTLDEVFADPQVQHLGLELRQTHPTQGKLGTIAPAARFSDTPWQNLQPPPTVGEHTDEILEELGLAHLREVAGGIE